ncbi:glucokinase [Nonomuraea roseoviolacea]|uniref:Glucokinase n=1 Tax=Nonomuraea roseoviolacea subsp. carminata TaxID=160689 RepID=A0ABT1K2G4_9ACTN|nr:glucokinase [Nonomuraea roseoviolacea]MCP2347829.1 glucokinase [Nonomuraea roseoviolacea subsp. carminata]
MPEDRSGGRLDHRFPPVEPDGTGLAGVDAGGMTVLVRHEPTGEPTGETIGFRGADFGSLDALLHHCLTMIGRTPQMLVAGVAGQPRPNGDVRVTNRPDWPVFRRDRFAATYGIRVETVNDMEAMAAGVGELDESGHQRLTAAASPEPGAEPGPGPGEAADGRARLVVAVDSGVGVGHLDPHGRPHGTEGGHIPWQPRTRRESDYLAWLRGHRTGSPAPGAHASPPGSAGAVSVEESISGSRGFTHLYDFVALSIDPAPLLAAGVERARSERLGIAPLVIAGALAGDEFCVQVMRLFGGILGQFLRSMALVTLGRGGSVWLCGSVLRAPGVADFLMADGCLTAAFRPAGAEHADLMDAIPIHLVHDREIGVRGALALGRSRFQSTGRHQPDDFSVAPPLPGTTRRSASNPY